MKFLAILFALLPVAAFAQQPQPSIQQQLDGIVASANQGLAVMRSQILADQTQIADLQHQLEDAKKAPPAVKP